MVAETLACRNIPNMADSSKNIKKKNQNAPTRTHKKNQISLYKFSDEYA